MASHSAHGHDTITEDGASHNPADHIPSLMTYGIVFGALMVLLILTIVAASWSLGPLNIVVALAIAIIKATLVVLYFMNVKNGTRLTWLWAGLGFLWLILMFGTLGDYVTRGWVRVEGW